MATTPSGYGLTTPLNLTTLIEAGVARGPAAMAAEVRKHGVNDRKRAVLRWVSIPMVAGVQKPSPPFLG